MKKILCIILTFFVLFSNCIIVFAENSELETIVEKNFILENETVKFDEDYLNNAGSSANDWYVIALKCGGFDAEYSKYLDALTSYVMQKYETENKLHPAKATEWHRIALTVEACGGDPTNVGGIDLISDGIYYKNLNKQGINAYIWALICLGTGDFQEPSDAENTKNSIIDKIVSSQLEDGGFTLSGSMGDVDVTSMVVYALSNFNNDDYDNVSECVNKAVDFLANSQNDDGSFASYGIKNCESSSQVVIALCSLGISPSDDERFTKNGASAYEYIYTYWNGDGFKHIADGETNFLATYQAMLAISAYSNIDNGSVFNMLTKSDDIIFDDNQLSNSDIELIKVFAENVNASDYQTLKRLLQTIENYDGDDKFLMETTLNLAISDAENIMAKIDDLEKDIENLSNARFKFLYKKDYKEIEKSFCSLSESDQKLVENSYILKTLEAEINTQIRQLVITILIFIALVISLVYLWKKHRKSSDD